MADNSTYVSSESRSLFDNVIASNPQLHRIINDVRNESNIFLCKIIRIYPYSDKAYVKVLNTGKSVWCRITHDILDSNMGLVGANRGSVKTGNETNATYIEPYDEIYGIVAKVRWDKSNDENCLISCVNLKNNYSLSNVVGDGEILITVGNSKLSITNERVNIISPKIFINGLPYDAPELTNHFDKTEIEVIVNNIIEENNMLKSQISEINNRLDNISGPQGISGGSYINDYYFDNDSKDIVLKYTNGSNNGD